MPDLLKAILLGIIEGVTEFLPVSSTGHLLLADRLMGLHKDPQFWQMFVVFIQGGAIAAVVVYFRERIMELLRGQPERKLTPLEISTGISATSARAAGRGAGDVGHADPGQIDAHADAGPADAARTGAAVAYEAPAPPEDAPVTSAQRGWAIMMIVLASLPLGVAYFADKWAEQHMQSSNVIAAALLVGGLLMILIEWLPLKITTRRIEHMTWKQALGIGAAQVVAALFPGTSRSAATIMGGLVAGLSRPAAAEFSFFLAIPAMGAACTYKLYKFLRERGMTLAADEMLLLVIGTLVSFLVAWAVIALFMGYIRRHSFVPFAIYRILLGLIVFWFLRSGDVGTVVTEAALPLP